MAEPLITGVLLEKIVEEIIGGAKKIGSTAFRRWEESRFSSKIARRINAIGKVKTLWSQDKELLISEFYYQPKIRIDEQVIKASKISDLPEGALIIEGIAGQGKSILLRSLAFTELKSNEGILIPIFLELRTLTSKMGLRDAILKLLYSYDIDADDQSIEYIFKCGKFSLILDGFDEVESQLINDLLSDVESIVARYPKLRLIITSRPYDEIQKSTFFKKITIEPLKVGDYVEFLKAGGFTSESAISIRDAIQRSSGEISGLIKTPLMLTLVGQLYQSEFEIPDNTPEFFERLFRHTFVTHDKLKAGIKRKRYTILGDRKLQELLEAFCFICMCEGIVATINTEIFSSIFNQALEYVDDCNCDADSFLQDITKGACLMLLDGDENIHFLHKSLLDYFSAAFIKKADADFSDEFYKNVADDSEPWFQSLSFLQYIDSSNFYKKFLLPEIERILDVDFDFLESRDEAGLRNFITKNHPDAGIIFKENGLDELEVAAFGPFSKPSKFCFKDLMAVLTRGLNKTAQSPVSKSYLLDESKNTLQAHELGLFLPLPVALTIWGSKDVFDVLDIHKTSIMKKRDEAMRLLSVNKKKTSLITKIKSSAST
jgi:hypothetical protein